MNELIRKHIDLSNSIIKKGQSYFQSSENSKSDSKLTFMSLCFLGHLTYLGDALIQGTKAELDKPCAIDKDCASVIQYCDNNVNIFIDQPIGDFKCHFYWWFYLIIVFIVLSIASSIISCLCCPCCCLYKTMRKILCCK